MESKLCPRCGLMKPLDSYHIDKQGKHGRNSRCKECEKAYRRELRRKKRLGTPAESTSREAGKEVTVSASDKGRPFSRLPGEVLRDSDAEPSQLAPGPQELERRQTELQGLKELIKNRWRIYEYKCPHCGNMREEEEMERYDDDRPWEESCNICKQCHEKATS